MTLSSDLVFGVGMFAGWLAMILAFVWQPEHRCANAYCPHRTEGTRIRRGHR